MAVMLCRQNFFSNRQTNSVDSLENEIDSREKCIAVDRMAPSRSRKRASTLKTVDLLNNLSHGSDRTLRSRQRKEDTEPRSDDVSDIMSSPGVERAVDGGTRRPRRSTRSTGVRTEPDVSTSLGDTGEREGAEGEGAESDGGEQEGQDEEDPDEQGQEQDDQEEQEEHELEQEQEEQEQDQHQEYEQEQDKDKDHDHGPDDMLYMFSDDENEARRSRSRWESPQLPSPSAFNEQLITSYGESRDGSRSLLSGSTRYPEVHIENGDRESSLFVRQDEPIQHESTHDHDPVFAPESSESSSSESGSESESESPQLDKRRRVVHEDKDRSRHVRISPHGKDAGAGGVDDKARDLQWMQKAMNLGQQRDNWLVVTSTAKELSRMADDPDGAECDDICALIRGLRSLYGEMDASSRPSTATLGQCDNVFTSVSRVADQLLDRVYYLATDDGPCGRAQDLMAAFDTRVVPGLVRLVIVCFRVYYTAPLLFSGLPEHLRRTLLVLRGLWVRTTSMKAQRIVHGGGGGGAVKHGKAFGQAVHGILQALETGALRPWDLPGNDEDYSQDGREWTRDEGLALIDGLQLYQGMLFISFSGIGYGPAYGN